MTSKSDTDTPWTPYADGSSGHQGEGSEAAEPSRRSRIDEAHWRVQMMLHRGITWRELAEATGWHHGVASSALSNLHRSGAAVRLQERREGCGVYVTPENARDRLTVAHRRSVKRYTADEVNNLIEEWRGQAGVDRFLTGAEIDDLKGRF